MTSSLVGSEMCIRDSLFSPVSIDLLVPVLAGLGLPLLLPRSEGCLIPVSYTHLTLPTICSV
eukprot:4711981-Prorocentrum_lima.AAC.1